MFNNFIYVIIAVLIYSTYNISSPVENLSLFETLFIFICLSVFFFVLLIARFRKFERQIEKERFLYSGNRFDSLTNKGSIFAILLFAVDVYGLNLPFYTRKIQLFGSMPALDALLFICLFLFYLSLIWGVAYNAHRKLNISEYRSRFSYIISNISFCLPVFVPWLILSILADIINLLPYETPKLILSTAGGELALFLSFLVIVSIFGPLMIQKLWRCKPVEEGKERSGIETICRKTGVGFSDILYWPVPGNRMITAGVMGLVKKFRYILVTKTLLRLLSPEEVEAVIAHEAGHIRKNHLLFYILFLSGYIIIAVSTTDIVIYLILLAKPLYGLMTGLGVNRSNAISVLYGLVVTGTFLFYFRFVFGYFMRNFERQADAYVYSIFENAEPLISTFKKIASAGGSPPDKPNWHHFSIDERIQFLEKCNADRSIIKRHENKIKKSMVIYLAGMILIGAFGYMISSGERGKIINEYFAEKIIMREIRDNPGDPDLPAMLGDLYYGLKDYDRAKEAYEKSLSIAPESPKVLNNLAWLYATSEDINIRNSDLAVKFAEKAVKIEESSQVFDTLAESYYAAGRYREAVEAGKKALMLAVSDKTYYEKQLAKFIRSGP
jgi:Zn-dependent protease with chaperone function